jgi:hypothetical protein
MPPKLNNQYYLGNPNLKNIGVQLNWTQDEINEYAKCKADPLYFAKKFVKIIHVDYGLIPYKPWKFQENMIKLFNEERFVICKMPRQTGKSTTIIAYLLWYALFHRESRIAILANKKDTALELMGRLQLAYEQLPFYMQQGIKEWNKGNIKLENESTIIATSTSSASVRGRTFNIVFLDEFAHVPPEIAEEFFRSTYPTISSGKTTKVFIVSTPKGLNMFYKLWVDAEEDRNLYKTVDVHWSDVPGRDQKWMEETIANTSQEQFDQEFGCEFIGSSDTLISTSKLKTLVFRNPIFEKDGMKIYEKPKPDHFYIMNIDTARGNGNDYSAFTVIDVTQAPYKLVAKYRNNKIAPMLFPTPIHTTAKSYNDAFLLIEVNDIGGQVADILHHEYEYENIIPVSTKGRAGQVPSAGFGGRGSSALGVKMTQPVKRSGCALLKQMIEGDQLIVEDFEIIAELTTFIMKGKTFQADEGHNDDLCDCLVTFCWLAASQYFKDLTDVSVRLSMYDKKMKQIEEDLMPFGFVQDGFQGEEPIRMGGDLWFTSESV